MRRFFNLAKDLVIVVVFGALVGLMILGVGSEFFQLSSGKTVEDKSASQSMADSTNTEDMGEMQKINLPEDPISDSLEEDEEEDKEDEIIVFASVPNSLSIPNIGINQEIIEYDDNKVAKTGKINPETLDMIVWWSGGGRPGASRANGEKYYTTYIYGHSTNNDKRKAIFDDLDLIEVGDEIVIATDSGDFCYWVKDRFIIPKPELPDDPRTTLNEEGRLLLISCYAENGINTLLSNDNIVVVAELKSVILLGATPEP